MSIGATTEYRLNGGWKKNLEQEYIETDEVQSLLKIAC